MSAAPKQAPDVRPTVSPRLDRAIQRVMRTGQRSGANGDAVIDSTIATWEAATAAGAPGTTSFLCAVVELLRAIKTDALVATPRLPAGPR